MFLCKWMEHVRDTADCFLLSTAGAQSWASGCFAVNSSELFPVTDGSKYLVPWWRETGICSPAFRGSYGRGAGQGEEITWDGCALLGPSSEILGKALNSCVSFVQLYSEGSGVKPSLRSFIALRFLNICAKGIQIFSNIHNKHISS